jgi:hypothetical protein
MKKVLALLSVVLIAVSFTNEAKAYIINDGAGFGEAQIVVASMDFPTVVVEIKTSTVDNVEVKSSVNDVVAVATSNMEVGGSIVSSDANYPDQDNLVATYTKRTMLLHLLSLRHPKKYLASVVKTNNTDMTDNYKPFVKVGEIPTNVGKLA